MFMQFMTHADWVLLFSWLFIFGYLFPMQKIVAMENVYLLERFIEIYNLVKQRNQVLKTIDDNFEKTSGLLHTNSSDGKKY